MSKVKIILILFIGMLNTSFSTKTLPYDNLKQDDERPGCSMGELKELFEAIELRREPLLGVKTVVIDAGHGGKDPGSLGLKNKEKDIALTISLKLGKYIEDNISDVKVIYTRKTDNFVELGERARIANKANADLFICIHCNANTRKEPKGSETYVMGLHKTKGNLDVAKRENSAILLEENYEENYEGFDPNSDEAYIYMSLLQSAYLENSSNFAAKVQDQFREKVGRVDRGVKQAGFLVLWRTSMPSVLIESGFITNPEEEVFLGSEEGQDYMASAIFRAFREYKDDIEGNLKKYNDELERKLPAKELKEEKASQETKEVILEEKESSVKLGTDSADQVSKIEAAGDKLKPLEKEEKKENPEGFLKNDEQGIVFKVQIFSSEEILTIDNESFKGRKDISFHEVDNAYKYTSGSFDSKEKANEHQATLRSEGFPGAFVVAFNNGKRIPVSDAIKLLNQ